MQIIIYRGVIKDERSTGTQCLYGKESPRLNGHLLDGSTVLNPTIKIAKSNSANLGTEIFEYNYMRIMEWADRYYFITNWETDADGYVLHATVDVMASWRDYILGSRQLVLRAESDYNGELPDTSFPAETSYMQSRYTDMKFSWYSAKPIELEELDEDVTPRTVEVVPGTSTALYHGSFILGVINRNRTGVGAVTYYNLRCADLHELMAEIYTNPLWFFDGIKEAGTELMKALAKPFDYIVSCMYFPFELDLDFFSPFPSPFRMGWWEIGDIEVRELDRFVFTTRTGKIELPPHPLAATYGSCFNASPYSRHIVFMPGLGDFELDSYLTSTHMAPIQFEINVDLITGKAIMSTLSNSVDDYSNVDNYRDPYHRTFQVGVPIQLSQMSANAVQTLSSVVTSAGALAAGAISGGVGLAAGGLAAALGVGNALDNSMPKLTNSCGSNGSIVDTVYSARITSYFARVVIDGRERIGRPLSEMRRLGDLEGYVKVFQPVFKNKEFENGWSIYPNRTPLKEEIDKIKMYMEEGFYIEL